jgi:hypothetical protein
MGQPTIVELQEAYASLEESRVDLVERIAELELEVEDREGSWLKLFGADADDEFSREKLRSITRLSRVLYLKNPLIRRAVDTRTDYVFGRGISISARHPLVDAVVQKFLHDKTNETEFSSIDALQRLDRTLYVDGNLFFVFFKSVTGAVRVRMMPFDEVSDVIRNPEDSAEVWFYLRERSVEGKQEQRLYPAWTYRPEDKAPSYKVEGIPEPIPVMWDRAVYHVATNRLPGQRFGTPETYSAQDWAMAYNEFLQNWATIVRSYARFAWRLVGPKKKIAAAKAKLGSKVAAGETNPAPSAGSMFTGPRDVDLQPIRSAGATTSAEDGRRLLLMVSAGTGIFEHYFGDPSTGNLATTTTMDRPMELSFKSRQRLWQIVIEKILRFVIETKALSGTGDLVGEEVESEDWDGETSFSLALDTENDDPEKARLPIDDHMTVEFPDILERDMLAEVTAIVAGATLNGLPMAGTFDLEYTTRRLLGALGETSIEERITELFPKDEDGNPIEPEAPIEPTPQQQSTEALRESIVNLQKWLSKKLGGGPSY